jgi:hypothetical protein
LIVGEEDVFQLAVDGADGFVHGGAGTVGRDPCVRIVAFAGRP